MWLKTIKPIHNLTEREQQVLAALLLKRQELTAVINDETLRNKILLSVDTRKQISTDCEISNLHIQVIYTKFKKLNILTKDGINPKFIPNINPEATGFQLLFLFDLNDK